MIERGPATTAEMVLAFVAAEIDASRFGPCYEASLARLGTTRARLIDQADLNDAAANAQRARMLGDCRGYPSDALFKGFPSDAVWRRAELEPDDLAKVKYANYPNWTALSGGTRRVVDGAANIDLCGDAKLVDRIRAVAASVRRGHRFPELVAVDEAGGNHVLVEGHTRATAYAIAWPKDGVRVLIGSSVRMSEWCFYPK